MCQNNRRLSHHRRTSVRFLFRSNSELELGEFGAFGSRLGPALKAGYCVNVVPLTKRAAKQSKDRTRQATVTLPTTRQYTLFTLDENRAATHPYISMYAIETKKRKFDRILDSIQDHSASQSNSSIAPRNNNNNNSTISLTANDQSAAAAKKLRLSSGTSQSNNDSTTSLASQKTANYLPTSRQAFLDRLQTFGPITKWHIASNEVISAAAWARRGWRCVGNDTVSCGACEERLLVKLDKDEGQSTGQPGEAGDAERAQNTEDEDNGYAMASEVHAGIVAKYEELITSAHSETCPWRRRGCIDSIQRIEGLLNAPTAVSGLQIRYDGIVASVRGSDIPDVCISIEESERYATVFQSLLSKISSMGLLTSNKNAYLLAVCGWQTAIEHGNDVVECRYCFRRLGLWLYRGNEPAMEKLDAIESHLEYCPWRSLEAQSTEISVGGTKVMVPGWVLVAQAVQRQKADTYADTPGDMGIGLEASGLPEDAVGSVTAGVGEKERETRVKDLLRRVKELKKPFNVKALLKRNKKPT
jgi:C3HC zinc finger-like/Rsm1-like